MQMPCIRQSTCPLRVWELMVCCVLVDSVFEEEGKSNFELGAGEEYTPMKVPNLDKDVRAAYKEKTGCTT